MLKGWRGIVTGSVIASLGWIVIQPVDFSNPYFIGALVMVIITSLTCIIVGVMTFGTEKKGD